MIDTLRFILSSQLKRSRLVHPISGFTLIELLIAMVLAVLVITPLLGFMVNILSTDRQEQAKTNSEQEVQAALDYITRDIQQAVYVYGSTAVESVKASLPAYSDVNKVPVLVFWKRNLLKNAVDGTKNDTFVYSLVTYYLIRDETPNSSIWSNAARIARWEIKDGVLDSTNKATGDCQGYSTSFCPSPGMGALISNQSSSVLDNLKTWKKKAGSTYTDVPVPLVDFIDHTTVLAGAPAATCPPGYAKLPSSSVDTLKMTGFYACVDEPNTTAQIYLRGNALMRLQNTSDQVYSVNKSNYFPSANALIQGRSYLFTK
jgi:prepilin-type N-terminal cleavage/methylation domain-containing protein